VKLHFTILFLKIYDKKTISLALFSHSSQNNEIPTIENALMFVYPQKNNLIFDKTPVKM
jgi:hypothetical protein